MVWEWDNVCCVCGYACWRVSTRISFWAQILLNLAETRDFCSADVGSAFCSSPEPVLFSRATHKSDDHGELRVGVKSDFFSRQYSTCTTLT